MPEYRIELPFSLSSSSLDLSSLNLNEKGNKFCKKRKMYHGSPVSPFGFSSSVSSPKSPGSISMNEYSHPSQVLSSEDDYFFFDLESAEKKILEPLNQESKPTTKKKSDNVEEAPKLIEDFVVFGSEVISRYQLGAMQRKDKEQENNLIDSPVSEYGLCDTIKTNFLLAISSISPKSVRKIFNADLEPFDELEENDDKENSENVTIAIIKEKSSILKKESSNDFSDMIKPYYKAFEEPECKDNEMEEENSDYEEDTFFGIF